jgi:hypothetical protein
MAKKYLFLLWILWAWSASALTMNPPSAHKALFVRDSLIDSGVMKTKSLIIQSPSHADTTGLDTFFVKQKDTVSYLNRLQMKSIVGVSDSVRAAGKSDSSRVSLTSHTSDTTLKFGLITRHGKADSCILADTCKGGAARARFADSSRTCFKADSALKIPNVITAGGPIGTSKLIPVITYNAQGRLTAVSTVAPVPDSSWKSKVTDSAYDAGKWAGKNMPSTATSGALYNTAGTLSWQDSVLHAKTAVSTDSARTAKSAWYSADMVTASLNSTGWYRIAEWNLGNVSGIFKVASNDAGCLIFAVSYSFDNSSTPPSFTLLSNTGYSAIYGYIDSIRIMYGGNPTRSYIEIHNLSLGVSIPFSVSQVAFNSDNKWNLVSFTAGSAYNTVKTYPLYKNTFAVDSTFEVSNRAVRIRDTLWLNKASADSIYARILTGGYLHGVSAGYLSYATSTTAWGTSPWYYSAATNAMYYSGSLNYNDGVGICYTGTSSAGGGLQLHIGSAGTAPSSGTLKSYLRVRGTNYNTILGIFGGTVGEITPMEVENNTGNIYLCQTSGKVSIGSASGLYPLYVNATATTDVPIVKMQNNGNANFIQSIHCLAPNLSTGRHAIGLNVGVAHNTRNDAYLGFYYAGSGSTSNYLTLGLFGVDDVLNICGNGNVGIGTTSPIYLLDINGTYRAKKEIVQTSSFTISGTQTIDMSTTNNVLLLTDNGTRGDVYLSNITAGEIIYLSMIPSASSPNPYMRVYYNSSDYVVGTADATNNYIFLCTVSGSTASTGKCKIMGSGFYHNY